MQKSEQTVNPGIDEQINQSIPVTRAMDIFKRLEEKLDLYVSESPRLNLDGLVTRDEVTAGLMVWAALEAYEFISANIESINDKRMLLGFLGKTYEQIIATKDIADFLEWDFTHAAKAIHELHEYLSSLSVDDLAELSLSDLADAATALDLIDGLASFGVGFALSFAVKKLAQRINGRKREELQNTFLLLQRLNRFTILAKRRAPTGALLSEYKELKSHGINLSTGLE